MAANRILLAAGLLSALAAALHLAIIAGGPGWYRFFGAGEGMVRLATKDWAKAATYAVAIAAVLALWAGYAFAGAGLLPHPPLLRTGLIVIAAIYLARGCVLFAMLAFKPQMVTPFWVWSSLIVLAFGACYAVGTWTAWPSLSPR